MSGRERISVTSGGTPTWRLARAVLVYEREHVPADRLHAYATLHNVHAKNGKPELAAGVPATREACADLARALGAAAAVSGFMPASLLFLGTRSVIWWRPPGPARMHFDTTGTAAGDQLGDVKGAALIGRRAAVTPQPGLVFAVRGRAWYVYAVRGPRRPVPADKLQRAPYFNVWAGGEICTGTTPLPEQFTTGTLDAYEEAFFGSNFTHPNVKPPAKLVEHPGGPYAFWRDGLDGKWGDAFPLDALVPEKLTLQGLAKKLEEDRE